MTEPIATDGSTIKRITWAEFQESGLFWAANRWLHMFGLVIVIATDDETGEFVDAYPARTTWRGFPRESEERGFERVAAWMRSLHVKDGPPVDDAPELGPIALAKSRGEVPADGTPCRTVDTLGSTDGMIVTSTALQGRQPGVDGTLLGIVCGHGGDVWWVLNGDGGEAAYASEEVEDRL